MPFPTNMSTAAIGVAPLTTTVRSYYKYHLARLIAGENRIIT